MLHASGDRNPISPCLQERISQADESYWACVRCSFRLLILLLLSGTRVLLPARYIHAGVPARGQSQLWVFEIGMRRNILRPVRGKRL